MNVASEYANLIKFMPFYLGYKSLTKLYAKASTLKNIMSSSEQKHLTVNKSFEKSHKVIVITNVFLTET